MRSTIQKRIANRTDLTGRSEQGIGLAEVLICLAIFSTAMLGIIGTSARVGLAVNGAHKRLESQAVARQQLESVMALDYSKVVDGTADRNGVKMKWGVVSNKVGKKVLLVYQYTLPHGVRTDTLTAAMVRR